MESLLHNQQEELASDIATPSVPTQQSQKKHTATVVFTTLFVVLTATAVLQSIEMVRLRGYLGGLAAAHASDGTITTTQGSQSPSQNASQGQAQVGLPSQVGGC